MIRLLKADIYKMFRMPSFWITTLVAWGISFINNQSVFYENLKALNDLGSSEVLTNLTSLPSLVPTWAYYSTANSFFYLSIFVIMFAVADFSTGTIKNIATKGFLREEIYFSKFICSIIAAFISIAGCFGLTYALGAVVFGNKQPMVWIIPENFARDIFLRFLSTIVIISFCLMIAFIVRSTGASLGIFFVYTTIFEILLFAKIIPTFLKPVLGDVDIMPYSMLGCLNPSYDLTRGLIIAFTYIIGLTLIGLITFRKRDIN